MKRYDYEVQSIENEIMAFLNKRPTEKSVIIESGAVNDVITGFEVSGDNITEREVIFTTTACVFPEKINLQDYEGVELEKYNGSLFVSVKG